MEKLIFVTTLVDAGKVRVRALPNQFFSDSGGKDAIRTDWNIQCDKVERTKYPLATTFAVKGLTDKGSFYQANTTDLLPIADTSGGRLTSVENHWSQYQMFSGASGTPDTSVSKEETVERPPTLLDRIRRTKELAPPTLSEEGFYVHPDLWYTLVRNLKHRKNTLLIGPTGSGKTEIIELLAKRTKKDCHVFNMGTMHDPISGLLGVHRLNDKGHSEFDFAKFATIVQEPGIAVLDEINRAPQSANNILFPVLDRRRELPIDVASSKVTRSAKVSPDMAFFATANLGGEYAGTNSFDRALFDRFFPVELDYLDKNIEAKVLCTRTTITNKDALIISNFCAQMRGLAKKGQLSTAPSMRHSLEIAELFVDGFDMLKACEAVLYPLYEGTKAEGERATVAALLISK